MKVRQNKNGVYYIDYRILGKRHRRIVGTNKKLAENVLSKIRVAIIEKKYFDILENKKISFEEMSHEYFERHSKVNKRSWSSDKSGLKRLCLFFKNKLVTEISPQLLEDYKIKRLNDGVAKATINRELALIKNIFTKAVEWNKISNNPTKSVKLFKENNKRTRFLEKGELKMLIDNCEEPLKSIVFFAVNTGMRLSEILNLVWDDIDFSRGSIRVRNTKNSEDRFVPVNTNLRNMLEERKNNNFSKAYVFCNTRSDRFRIFTISHRFAEVIKKCGIKDFRFHDLRHTFASHLVMSGADIVTVKELLGHKTLEMTMRYSHLSPDFKKSTIELLSNKMGIIWAIDNKKKTGDVSENMDLSSEKVKIRPRSSMVEQLICNQ